MNLLHAPLRCAVLATLLAGCASVASFQTGKVLPKGGCSVGGALGAGKIDTKSDIAGFDGSIPSVTLDLWLRGGLFGFMDAGGKITFPGYTMAEARGALAQESRGHPLSAALGLGYGFSTTGIKASSYGASYEDVVRLDDLITTLYLSRDVTPRLTLYVSPRHVRRRTRNRRSFAGADQNETFRDDMAGGAVGLRLGAGGGAGLMAEYARMQDTNESDHRQTYLGLGLDIQFGVKKSSATMKTR